MSVLLKPRASRAWRDQARATIHRLEEGHRVIIRPAGVGLSASGSGSLPDCYPPRRLDLVTLHFDFRARELVTVVRCQRIAAIALLKALRIAPLAIVVGYGGTGGTASYRSCELQAELYARYQAGTGGKAAPPGRSWHNRGLSLDAPSSEQGHVAMRRCGFRDGVSGDPSHFTYGVFG